MRNVKKVMFDKALAVYFDFHVINCHCYPQRLNIVKLDGIAF